MKGTSKNILAAVGLLAILLANYSPSARAGWSVSVGLDGKGTVKLKVSNACGSNVVTTPFMLFPSATFNRQSNTFVFATNAPAPACSTNGTYVQVRASTNYVTSIQSATGAGDTNDSDEVLQFVIPRSACASGDVDVVPINITSNAVTFHYTAKLSDEGSAALFRIVDSVTGQQRYVVLIVGPYDNTTNSCEGTFTVIGDPTHLNLLVDGNTSTLPFDIACPGDIVVPCDAPPLTTYNPPAVATGVTGPFTVTYVPAPSELVLGVTNTVIATARDTNGCTVKCQFNVYRQPISFDGFYSPIGGADDTGGSCAAPLRIFKLGSNVAVKFDLVCNGLPVTSGTPIISIRGCTGTFNFQGPFQLVNSQWHFNIDSTVINAAGKYFITALLPDGSQHTTVLQFKR